MVEPAKAQTAVTAAYTSVRQRISSSAARAGRSADAVGLVAVTKTASDAQVLALLAAGHRDLAENRVQALIARIATLAPLPVAPEIRWHMIGHLQRNKVPQLLGRVTLIHSLDTVRLAEAIGLAADKTAVPAVGVLLEVNISGEDSKFGVPLDGLDDLADRVAAMPRLRLRGLMTMAPYSDRPEDSRPIFARCRQIFERLRARLGPELDTLSMGMSGDFEVAIEEGATIVRVGRALFD